MPDVILIHGALGAIDQLAPLAAQLSPRLTVHRLELSGHGATPSTSPYNTAQFTRDVRAFAAEKGIARAAIFGYSMGGYVALALAADAPDFVTRVATLGTKLAWSAEVAVKETSRLHAPTIRAKVPKFADALERRHAGAGGWELVLERTAAFMTSLGDAPIVDDDALSRIRQPTRLMVGDRDNVVSVEETRRGASVLRSGELAVLPNTPHPVEQVRLALLGAHLNDFFDVAE